MKFVNQLNPFVKALTLILAALILGFSFAPLVNSLVFLGSLVLILFFSNANKKTLGMLMIPVAIAVVSLFMTGYLNASNTALELEEKSNVMFAAFDVVANSGGSVYAGLQLSTRVAAFSGLGILFALTTDREEFILSLMHQGKLRPKMAYGILAAFNLIPDIRREYDNARLAYRVKGIKVKKVSLKPFFSALVNCVRWSETLSMAMESKGFDGDGDRTFSREMKVRGCDYAFLVVVLGTVVTGLIFASVIMFG